jgi:signal transduction histidine kinase
MNGASDGSDTTSTTLTQGSRGSTLRDLLLSPLDPASWRATLAVFLGFGVAIVAFNVLIALLSTGGSLVFLIVGIPILALGIEWARLVARVERRRMSFVDGRPMQPHVYRPLGWSPREPYGEWLQVWAGAAFLDPSRWRDVVYCFVLLPLAIVEVVLVAVLWLLPIGLIAAPVVLAALGPVGLGVEVRVLGGELDPPAPFAVAIALLIGVVLLPVAAACSRGLMVLHRSLVEALLCLDQADELRRDVARLRESRSVAVELEAGELRRIERDLHDGAQQRLVRLAMDLGMAEERIETDPASARALVSEARAQARLALSELRDLVRGAAPSILADRGLVAAVGSLAGRCPVPTALSGSLPVGERLPPAVERTAYFAVAEALTNVARHSGARRCDVGLWREPTRLVVEVRDDGRGGAGFRPGGGLAGLRDRAATVDGTLLSWSPPGGPTVVRLELPLAAAVAGGAGGVDKGRPPVSRTR